MFKRKIGKLPEQTPMRAELFSADQMEQHGKTLAATHVLGKSTRDYLLQRLDDNEKVLLQTRELLTISITTSTRVVPAAEWLLDNFYLIEEEIRTARQHLPKPYSRELPHLSQGPSAGLPRVYDLALAAIAHSDGRLDASTLGRFIAAYQSISPLKLGELWAIPIMLRLALIENLRRVGARLTSSRMYVDQAQQWAEKMIEMATSDPKSLILVIADMARSNPPMMSSFVAELTRRLQGLGPALAMPLTWIEQRLAEASMTIEQLVLVENQQLASDQVSISSSICSLRLLGAMDWQEFVESMSGVEQTLREDPAGVYGAMNFATRDQYRHVIGRLARESTHTEIAVAQQAVALATNSAAGNSGNAATQHVGYYLIDKGLSELEALLNIRLPVMTQLRRTFTRFPLTLHLGAIGFLTLLFTGLLLGISRDAWLAPSWAWLALVPAVLASSQLASALVNWSAILLGKPDMLPRMHYPHGLPVELRTLVVVPTMLGTCTDNESLLEALEVRYLGNQDPQIFFGLLTDFRDAAEEVLPGDAALLSHLQQGINALNAKYRRTGANDSFYLFHRQRRWNAVAQMWMGYERKRGKLSDLNALLRGDAEGRFSKVSGKLELLQGVRYVITLDTDTELPRDSARILIATMAHPLNQPRYEVGRKVVTDGYGILQPMMAPGFCGTQSSHYARLSSSEPGIDPYTRSVSDVYQDLFGEGSFIGKGIYDVDAFERALSGRFPENRILSHDLLEGCYARSGLLSDVRLYEDHPARYAADVNRQRRWIRGDWQIAAWLLPQVPGSDSKSRGNPLSTLSRWKIFDNLRRSLVTIALVLLLLLGWSVSGQPWLWTLVVIGSVLLPALLSVLASIFRKPEDVVLSQHLGALLTAVRGNILLAGFRLACMPYEAWYSLDAIVRANWRLLLAKHNLLEWTISPAPATCSSTNRGTSLLLEYRQMWIAPVLALASLLLLLQLNAQATAAALPLLVLWFLAPLLAWWISLPLSPSTEALLPEQQLFLRRVARRTWAFFDTFVTADDHWLPPDNYQQHPGPILAHRTSPTNMGLALLANLSAWDFAYIPASVLLTRTAGALNTMAELERHQGHFYNWYDTLTLQPLPPRYISSVDSGNLAAHLLTLREGLLAMVEQPIVGTHVLAGLADTNMLLAQALTTHAVDNLPENVQSTFLQLQSLLDVALREPPEQLPALLQTLQNLNATAADLYRALDLPQAGNTDAPAAEPDEKSFWAQAFWQQSQSWCDELLEQGEEHTAARRTTIEQLAKQATSFADMDYEFLYDKSRRLLAIGYNVDEFRRDTSFYDLLASEARLASFVAIAQGCLPQDSWFALSRLLTSTGGEPVLVSWSGSMFEYLMPVLVMPNYENTLLERTTVAAVARQIAYGKQRGLPWGISESGFNTVDAGLNYQYHAFGVPGLGLKRGLADDLVIAPYASALALMVAPQAACQNLHRLTSIGMEGLYGFYEAIDYTPARLGRSQTSVIVRSFMAHHQGMTLLALGHVLLDKPMQQRFADAPLFQATLLLLQERIPATSLFYHHAAGDSEALPNTETNNTVHVPFGPVTPKPEVQLLSNGRYHVMVTNAGGGYSRCKDVAVTRWREDSTRDHWGSFVYLRDVDSGQFWSAAYQPTLKRADSYEALFTEGRAEFRRRDHAIETWTEIVVSPEDDVELRRLRLTNRSEQRRTIEIISYAEVALATPANDASQTAFGNLFVQTRILPKQRVIVCSRRPRAANEKPPCVFHMLGVNGTEIAEVSYETDRMRFIGRGRDPAAPLAMLVPGALSGSQGAVLDPIFSIRCRLTLEPHQTATLDLVSGLGKDADACTSMIEKYQDRHLADRAFDLAGSHGGVTLRQINADESDARLYRRLAGAMLYAGAALRADAALLVQNRRSQSGLWGYSISGDLPILLLKISETANIGLARQLIQCHAYWRLKGLVVDLVIWNEDHMGYRQLLNDQIMGLITTGSEAHALDRPGGIFVRSGEQISQEDRILLQSVARVIISDDLGPLAEQSAWQGLAERKIPLLVPARSSRPKQQEPMQTSTEGTVAIGSGAFSKDGREFVINSGPHKMTPLPWVNVLANPGFGSVVTESGLAYTWSENAHEFRLSPWSDDAVGARAGEALYLRDEESGRFWSPGGLPCAGSNDYVTRHGFGYSMFEHTCAGIHSELWMYVDLELPVKYMVLKVRNLSERTRRLSATGYVEWVLGDLRAKTAMHVVTEIDAHSGALFARNAYNSEFSGRVAFYDVDDISRTLTGDRSEFLGRNGSPRQPDALTRTHLSGRTGAGLDPCGAIQVPFELGAGQERQLIFRLGACATREAARDLALQLRTPGSARSALEKVRQYWEHTLDAVQITTPDAGLNALTNGWLLYQTLACRVWARSGFYQSGGAFGFRDQLQDVMALVHACPTLTRAHLLLSASRQFSEGDVQHWWHPPVGRGVRTRCSDDYLWLPLGVSRYVAFTGDTRVLDELVPFLNGRMLSDEEESYFDLPLTSNGSASLYQHCVLAIKHGLRLGQHGLPLMGSGDWNDGMNLVGIHGKGESVWLGFFLHRVLLDFADTARRYHDIDFAQHCREQAQQLQQNLERHAWDGQWYKRAWFDDGTPLGSSENDECKIDSIAQSWSVLSGAGDPERSQLALASLDAQLVKREAGLIQLFDPPFDKSALDPGYIKGYVPGVRENGGQYTHAAIWAAMAFAASGNTDKAWELLDLINPVNHGRTLEDVAVYKAEPYVVAADVYAITPHTGRGGWTWYTGSAGWLYRLIVETLLGLQRSGDQLLIKPSMPATWPGCSLRYRFGTTYYHISVARLREGNSVFLDGHRLAGQSITLQDDQEEHQVQVNIPISAISH